MGRAPALPPAEQSIFRTGLPRMGSAKVHFARLSRQSMIRKSVQRFSEKIMLKQRAMIRKSLPSGFDPMGGNRFSEEITLHRKA